MESVNETSENGYEHSKKAGQLLLPSYCSEVEATFLSFLLGGFS